MFTNPFNRKYESGGSVQSKVNSLVEKASKNSGVSVKELTNKMNEFSSDEAKGGAFAELIKSAASDEDTKERREAVASLKAMFKSEVKESTKFEDGGKFQSFICKHGHGGVNCGCGGKVVRGEEGLPRIDENNRTDNITGKKYQEVLPDGTIKQTLTKEEPDKTTSYTTLEITPQQDSLFRTWNTRYGNDNINTYRPASQYRWYHKLNPFVSIAPNNWIESFKQNFVQSEEDGGVVMGLDGLRLSRKQARELSGLNKGYNHEQFQSAMANADAALRNNTELRGRDLRQAKRMMVSGITPMERVVTMESSPVELDISLPTAETISNLNPNLELPVRKVAIPTSTSTIVRTKKPSRAAQALDNAVQYFATTAPSTVGAINYEGYRNPGQNFKDMWNHFTSLFKKEQGGQIEKHQNSNGKIGTRNLYRQITADGPETYTDGYGTTRTMYESPIVSGLRKVYHFINGDETLSDEAYLQKYGFSKPLIGFAPMVSPGGVRIPIEASLNQRGKALISAEANRQKAIEAATRQGRIYTEPKPSDLDIDKTYFSNSFNNIVDFIRNTKFTKFTK